MDKHVIIFDLIFLNIQDAFGIVFRKHPLNLSLSRILPRKKLNLGTWQSWYKNYFFLDKLSSLEACNGLDKRL